MNHDRIIILTDEDVIHTPDHWQQMLPSEAIDEGYTHLAFVDIYSEEKRNLAGALSDLRSVANNMLQWRGWGDKNNPPPLLGLVKRPPSSP